MKSQNCSVKQFLNEQTFIDVQIMCSEENREELAVEFRSVLSEIWGSCNPTSLSYDFIHTVFL